MAVSAKCSATPRLLSTAQGSLLDDEALVNALQSSKKTSEDVAEQLEVSEQTEIKIDAAREVGEWEEGEGGREGGREGGVGR